MPSEPSALLIVGLLILCGYGGGRLVGLLRLPAVTGYIIVGLGLGISGAAIVGDAWWHSLEWTVEFALSLVAFNVGYELRFAELARLGKGLTLLVVLETMGAFIAIWLVMLLVGLGWRLGMLIGAIGAATAPAVTVIVFNSLRAKGPLTQAVLACVGFDDALGLVIYSVVAPLLAAHGTANGVLALKVLYQLGLSIGVGSCLGALAVIVTRYIKHEAELMVAIVGIVVFCAGLLESHPFGLHCSPLLGAMMVGFLVGNFGRAPRRFGETFFAGASPFYTLYFALAGSRLRLFALVALWLPALGYLGARLGGKWLGAYIGGKLGRLPSVVTRLTGPCLFSQAGIAIGLTVYAAKDFPQWAPTVVAVMLGTTVVTEIVGPALTRFAVKKAGEARAA